MPPPFANFGSEAEWGLGVQLVRTPNTPPGPSASRTTQYASTAEMASSVTLGRSSPDTSWGHLAANGSFALVIPGERPLVAAFLTNRSRSFDASQRVLKALVEFANRKY